MALRELNAKRNAWFGCHERYNWTTHTKNEAKKKTATKKQKLLQTSKANQPIKRNVQNDRCRWITRKVRMRSQSAALKKNCSQTFNFWKKKKKTH